MQGVFIFKIMEQKKQVSVKTIWRHLWPHVKNYKWHFMLSLVLYGGGMILMRTLLPIQYKRIIDIVSTATDKALGFEQIMGVLLTIGLIFIGFNILFRSADFMMVVAQSSAIKTMRVYILDKVGGHSYRFFTENFSGALVAKAKRFVGGFEHIHDSLTFRFWMPFVGIVSAYVVLLQESKLIATLLILFLAFFILFVVWYVRKKTPMDLELAQKDSEVIGRFADLINNVVAIKIFSKLKKEKDNFEEMAHEEHEVRSKNWRFANLQFFLQAVIAGIAEIVLLYFSFKLWRDGQISVGTIVLIQLYLTNIFITIWDIGRTVTVFIKHYSDLSEMVEIMDQSHEVQDPAHPEPLTMQDSSIHFDNVTFSYIDGSPVFDNFDLKVAAGQKVGIVGYSGAGKSTLVKLLLRFTDIDDGRILVGGQDIRTIRQDDLRSVISFIPQETVLFHRTIAENIGYSKDSATHEEIVSAAQKAFADDFIQKLSEKYETLVGERGVKLSGGERQRVAIARAVLKDAPILVMDEATSSLDSMSEEYIQKSFESLMEGRTVMVIAHRLSTIKKMDRIVVLGPDGIEEDGTHDELLEKQGKYYDLWQHQSGGFIE